MIDIHTHIIPKIDDGARSVEETFALIKEAETAGITDIILTPHYISGYYDTNSAEVRFWVEKLQEALENQNINVKLHHGMEIYISNELEKQVDKKEVITLNDSKYLLVELPMRSEIKYAEQILFKVQSKGYKVIIAHPERYDFVQANPNIVQDFIDRGYIIQSNFGSIVGVYGKKAEKAIKELLSLNLVHVLASDSHREGTIYTNLPKILKKVEKLTSKKQVYELTVDNPQKILQDKEIIV